MFDEPQTILMIEDNPVDAHLIKELLGNDASRFSLIQVSRLAEGLSRLEQGDIDLVLTDLGLPDSNGLDTLIQLLHQVPEIPIVVLTSNEDNAVVDQAMIQGAQDYLVKGQFDRNTLLRSLRYALARNRAEQALLSERDLAHAIIDTISSPVVVLDPAGRILQFNRACGDLTGYTYEDFWDTFFWDLFLPEPSRQVFEKHFKTEWPTTGVMEFDSSWLTKGGELRPLHCRGRSLTNRQGRMIQVIITGTESLP